MLVKKSDKIKQALIEFFLVEVGGWSVGVVIRLALTSQLPGRVARPKKFKRPIFGRHLFQKRQIHENENRPIKVQIFNEDL